jgi:hypothetical protein
MNFGFAPVLASQHPRHVSRAYRSRYASPMIMTDRRPASPTLTKRGYAAVAQARRETERDRVVASAPEPDCTPQPAPLDSFRDPINRKKFRRLDSNQDNPASKAGALPITLRRIAASVRQRTLHRARFHDTGRHPRGGIGPTARPATARRSAPGPRRGTCPYSTPPILRSCGRGRRRDGRQS